jgi:hypothetical protein
MAEKVGVRARKNTCRPIIFERGRWIEYGVSYSIPVGLSIPVENSPFCRLKRLPPSGEDGLKVSADWLKMKPAGKAEVGSGGDQPAKE